jgi:hypothetical protein
MSRTVPGARATSQRTASRNKSAPPFPDLKYPEEFRGGLETTASCYGLHSEATDAAELAARSMCSHGQLRRRTHPNNACASGADASESPPDPSW